MHSNIDINSFLILGYFVEYHNDSYKIVFSNIDKAKYRGCSEEELIDLGIEKFKSAIAKQFSLNKQHVVPLSGGLDSRAILGVLLEFTEANNIHTYTFGTPGTLDYDIGNYVAKKAGTNHVSFPLAEYQYTMDELIDIAKRIDYQTVLFHHPPVWKIDKIFGQATIWSGYVGDAVVGGHLKKYPSMNLVEAKERYLKSRALVRSIDLMNCKKSELFEHFTCDCIEKEKLSLDEQLLFQEGCQKITAPHVLMKGYQYVTPFINNSWMNFMFSIDNKYRINQYLYRKMLLKAFKKLFSLKTKNSNGLPLNASYPSIFVKKVVRKTKKILNIFDNQDLNYMDFDNAFRTRADLKQIIYENIMDLKNRKIVEWINIVEIWQQHINKRANHADALIALASLEIILKSQGY